MEIIIWAHLRVLCLCIHWFNPLVWAAAWCSRIDCEHACDEAVIRRLGEARRLSYGRALAELIAAEASPKVLFYTATTMVSGPKGIKGRIRFIAANKKPVLAAVLAVLFVSLTVVGCSFTGAQSQWKAPPYSVREAEQLVNEIRPFTSGPGDYVAASPEAYAKRLEAGYTILLYDVLQFERGEAAALGDQILFLAMKEILGKRGRFPEHKDLEEWFRRYRAYAWQLYQEQPIDEIETTAPDAYQLVMVFMLFSTRVVGEPDLDAAVTGAIFDQYMVEGGDYELWVEGHSILRTQEQDGAIPLLTIYAQISFGGCRFENEYLFKASNGQAHRLQTMLIEGSSTCPRGWIIV